MKAPRQAGLVRVLGDPLLVARIFRTRLAWITLGAAVGLIPGAMASGLGPSKEAQQAFWLAGVATGGLVGLQLWRWRKRGKADLSLPKVTAALVLATGSVSTVLYYRGFLSASSAILTPVAVLVGVIYVAALGDAPRRSWPHGYDIGSVLLSARFWRRFVPKSEESESDEATLDDLRKGGA